MRATRAQPQPWPIPIHPPPPSPALGPLYLGTGNRLVAPGAVPGWEAAAASAGTDFSFCLKMSRGFTALCAISEAASCEGEEGANPSITAPGAAGKRRAAVPLPSEAYLGFLH